jgi:prephenate dehydratase
VSLLVLVAKTQTTTLMVRPCPTMFGEKFFFLGPTAHKNDDRSTAKSQLEIKKKKAKKNGVYR